MLVRDLYKDNEEYDVFSFTVELFFRSAYNKGKYYNEDKPCYHLIGYSHKIEDDRYKGTRRHVVKEWDSNKEEFTLADVWDTKLEYEDMEAEYLKKHADL